MKLPVITALVVGVAIGTLVTAGSLHGVPWLTLAELFVAAGTLSLAYYTSKSIGKTDDIIANATKINERRPRPTSFSATMK